MAGASYEWCPICDQKALYSDECSEDELDRVVVVHRTCWTLIPPGSISKASREMLNRSRGSTS